MDSLCYSPWTGRALGLVKVDSRGVTGDHHHFKHANKLSIVTVPRPKKDLPKGTVNSIYKQAGWK